MKLFTKKCHFCKKKIEGKHVTKKVKVPGYFGLNKKHFCSQEHYEEYQNFIKQYEKHKRIPENSGCVSCAGKPRRV